MNSEMVKKKWKKVPIIYNILEMTKKLDEIEAELTELKEQF